MADACATCGRPRATEDTGAQSTVVCWRDVDRGIGCNSEDSILGAYWRRELLAAEKRALAAESALAAMRERAERAEARLEMAREQVRAWSWECSDLEPRKHPKAALGAMRRLADIFRGFNDGKAGGA